MLNITPGISYFHFSTGPPVNKVCSSVNSFSPGRFQFNFSKVIFKLTLVSGGWGISYEIALRWMPQDLTDDKSTLIQVMAWCHQATSHYLSQCWPRSMSPNGVTRPQWVNSMTPGRCGGNFNSMTLWYPNTLCKIAAWALTFKLLSDECHRISLRNPH